MTIFPDITLQQIIMHIVVFVVVCSAYGALIALFAYLLGDRGPKYDKRLSLSPASHIDWLGGALLIIFKIGWVKPIAVDPAQLKFGRLGLLLVILGSFSTLLLFSIVVWSYRVPLLELIPNVTVSMFLANAIRVLTEMSIWVILLNMLPLPPLTGGLLLKAALPKLAEFVERYIIWSYLLLGVIVVTGTAQSVLRPLYRLLRQIYT